MTRSQRDVRSTGLSSTRQPRGLRPRGQRARRRRADRAPTPRAPAAGQTLVEFALVLVIFMVVTLGLLDGLRVIFYYSQIQEAARLGARWGAVQVARAYPPGDSTHGVGGTFNDPGNHPGTYCDPSPPCDYSLTGSRVVTDTTTSVVTDTIVGAATLGMTAVNLSQASIRIDTTASTSSVETQDIDNSFTNQPVTVTVAYTFTPILSMGLGVVPLRGSSTMLHE